MFSLNVSDYIAQHGRMSESEARKKFWQIINAVEYCHKSHVVHRDLKVTARLSVCGASDLKVTALLLVCGASDLKSIIALFFFFRAKTKHRVVVHNVNCTVIKI